MRAQKYHVPTLYGMAATYDDQGNYVSPDGFDPERGVWLEGYDELRAAWEEQYARAHARWEAHDKQQAEAMGAEAAASDLSLAAAGLALWRALRPAPGQTMEQR